MAEAAAAEATRLLDGLLDEIVIWVILVRLDPKSLLRCRAVSHAWRCATSIRRFLLAHHASQPALPLLFGRRCRKILAFDHRAAQFHTVARFYERFYPQTSCDGLLLLLSRPGPDRNPASPPAIVYRRLTVYNPVTREHASLGVLPRDFTILGMYPHRPTGEYRLLLSNFSSPEGQIGFYIFALGSDQPPRYIGWQEMVSALCMDMETPALIRDSLHWFLLKHTKQVLVFDTMAESFRLMRAPVVPGRAGLFEMNGTLGIHSFHDATEIINIWVLHDYKSEVWDLKYRIKLPVAEIRERVAEIREPVMYVSQPILVETWILDVVSGDGDMLLLINFRGWLFRVDSAGKLIDSFDCGHTDVWMYKYRLKQSLVQHTFFPALKNYAAVTASSLI